MLKWEDVVRALEDPNYKWRTVRGLAKQLHVSESVIQPLLAEHAEEIIKSSIPAVSGEELYTTRRHYRQMTSVWDKLASGVTQTVSASSSSSSSSSSSNSSRE